MEKENLTKGQLVVLGVICGDIIGSEYEWHPTKKYDFELFCEDATITDDTVCTIAVADALISGTPIAEKLKEWCRKYFRAGYGGTFRRWILSDSMAPYNSWGNGSAMRVSSAAVVGKTLEEVMDLARKSAEVTHNHPQGIIGAQATAAAIFMAMNGATKEQIKLGIAGTMDYDLDRSYASIQPDYRFDVSCQGSVPESIICFLEGDDYESTIRKAIAMGGDADTMAAIAGGIAAAYYGSIPDEILDFCLPRIPDDMKEVIARLQ